jgi:hypothetical protein
VLDPDSHANRSRSRVTGPGVKRMRTRTRTWVRICAILLVLGLWLSGLRPVSAEPSAACRALAVRFADAAAGLDLKGLAELMRCLSVEMQDLTGGPEGARPAESAQPPPRPTGDRGQWPASPPWGSPWPSEGPGVR